MLDAQAAHKIDYEKYKDYVRNRELLFETPLDSELQHNYQLLFTFSKLTHSLDKIDHKSKIKKFYNETKNNLIIGFDLINMNYLNSGKQILRSSIESFFRLIISLSRYIEYKKNKSKRIYHATETLKELKSMADTHSVWKLNSFIAQYFFDGPIAGSIQRLNNTYSILSGNVHVNADDNFTLQEYLSEYAEYNLDKSKDAIILFNSIIEEILVVSYYISHLLVEEEIHFEKRDIQYFENNCKIVTSLSLDQIDSYFS